MPWYQQYVELLENHAPGADEKDSPVEKVEDIDNLLNDSVISTAQTKK
jgi:hypothetical protein